MYWLHTVCSLLLLISSQMSNFVAARFCEGGHICTLPRECCTQGCCPPYQSGPRQLPPPSEHVLNLFFISHWFFWCVVVAIILAILCAYSLWKKRRTLCGWGLNEHHNQSEGDSAGSCYAPPQYSRCNSFHHPPPPYTEVTSKPDLYPLVFTCNSDNGKNGSSYLMVQYFRNYIVRPVGSLSAASTVDSLSSSFICNVNEANTLVPPPYSRAASPDIGFSAHFQQYNMMPRSASQLVCGNNVAGGSVGQQEYHSPLARTSHYAAVTLNNAAGGGTGNTTVLAGTYQSHMRTSESGNFQHQNDDSGGESSRSRSGSAGGSSSSARDQRTATFIQSHSDQHFRYIANSNSSISDIFVNNSCVAGITSSAAGSGGGGGVAGVGVGAGTGTGASPKIDDTTIGSATGNIIPQSSATPVIYSNGCIQPHPLHRASTNPTSFVESHMNPVYNSCNSIGGISITVPVATCDGSETEFRDLQMLRRSLETCCQLLQQQQQQQQQHQQQTSASSGNYSLSGDSPLRMHDLAKKYIVEEVGALRSYVTSGTCSGVSSLANVGTPSSPPQATSPTGEVKEILDQIRQLQAGVSDEDLMLHSRPILQHTLSSPTPTPMHTKSTPNSLQRFATMPEDRSGNNNMPSPSINSPTSTRHTAKGPIMYATPIAISNSHSFASQHSSSFNNKPPPARISSNVVPPTPSASNKRPSTLQHSKRKFYSPKPNKAMYIPMVNNASPSSSRCILRSPVSSVVGTGFFSSRGRVRKGWISRSAPTTPGATLPPNRLGDDSPLLNEHDEDQEGEQIAEME